MVAKNEKEKIELLDFRKKAFGRDFAIPRNVKMKVVKRKGRKRVKDKLREQLLKYYGFVLEDN